MTTKKQSVAHATNEHNQTLVNHIISQVTPKIKASLNCSSITKDSKDDLFQDIILKLLLNIAHFDFKQDTPIEHYINKIVKTTKADYFRRRALQNVQRQALVQEFRVNYESRTQQQNIEVIILRNELKTILNQSFERLTILERTIMTDIVYGYKPHSIAQRFNIEHKVVYNGIQRAKRKIKRYLLLWWQ
ncbi:sigma-70 family RNA polymerase sigma factor [Staphylococcus arlettae]|uniref:sigma-70 family RNA polymerase sigma factor n=1 Tax=Staphylococcus arlettae TaxID=29378 RepID=UPI001E3236DC|nr:sigma-70 family RNA polymerase sigma factor [Staphylococcus arlettae]MCD8834838.1 sigma-70 family RNA polymerase sigma factor [Staphylococcus arlettae]